MCHLTSVGCSVGRWRARGDEEEHARNAPVVQIAKIARSYLEENITMRFVALCAVAISLICVASAVTITQYNDASCGTPTATTAANPNPQQLISNTCTSVRGGDYFIMVSSCTSKGQITYAYYSDAACAKKDEETDIIRPTDKCIVQGRSSTSSIKFTCDSASSVGLAFLAVFAAVLTTL